VSGVALRDQPLMLALLLRDQGYFAREHMIGSPQAGGFFIGPKVSLSVQQTYCASAVCAVRTEPLHGRCSIAPTLQQSTASCLWHTGYQVLNITP
jgi:hypothetical protein